MIAKNIKWDIDKHDATEFLLDSFTVKEIADFLKIDEQKLNNLSDDDLYDKVTEELENKPEHYNELYDLPDSVEIPEDLTDEDDITEWLTNQYEFCVKSYNLEE